MTNKVIRRAFILLMMLPYFCTTTFAQKPTRVELALPANSETYQAVPMGNKGVLLISQTSRSSYNVQRFDTNLERVWSIDGTIEAGLDYVTSTYDGRSVFLLFSRYRSSTYQIVKVNIGPGFVETFTINTLDRFQITDFKTLGYSMFMAGTVREEPILIHTNLSTLQTKVLPSAIKGSNAIQSIEIDTTHQLVNVSFAVKRGKQIRIVAHSYDESGQLFSQIMVEPEDDYTLLNGRLQVLNETTKLMIGTYGYRNMQSSTNTASQGLFITKIVDDEVVFTRYHSFTDFANFFTFMNDRQQEKMERRIKKKKETGGDLKLNYRLLVHDIIQKDNQFILVSEAFYPEYRTNNSNLMGVNSFYGNPFLFGSPFIGGLYNPWLWNPLYGSRGGFNNQIFDGFVYTHAIVVGFDQEGQLIWDNSINFENVKSMELKEKVNVQLSEQGRTQLVYSHEGAIRTKIIKENSVVDVDRKVDLPTGFQGDKVRKTSTDDVEYWYNNYYLAWGTQKIVNAATGDDQSRGRRNVFYLNKITF
ncbi:hypothetical protein [Arundinibacter roseus]|uniref:Uncharacterized protein n=1 Tax=Arundinibacter roseus TaxID=2070510 RepID=A0A4R4KGY5_9BACT|nr:hypothetical protein [Arundinibacter roseus]TDB67053.1 hypothetical protein EZE20_08040 [Arundinibacter roseus]